MSETVERLCGKCRFPIHRYDTVRHYGLYEAHLESRCIELLHAEVARLRVELTIARETNKALNRRCQAAESACGDWREARELTKEQRTGRFWPALSALALKQSEEEITRLTTALAAERERALCDALAWAWYEIGDGDHRDKGGFDPGRDEFVAAGLIAIRAITPAPGAADTHTEGT